MAWALILSISLPTVWNYPIYFLGTLLGQKVLNPKSLPEFNQSKYASINKLLKEGKKCFEIQFFSFTKEENFWLNEQHSKYSQVKLKLKAQASSFSDLFLTLFNLVDYKKPAQNLSKCVIEKLVIFLSNTKEFQALSIDQKQTVITRNVCFAASLITITADSIQDGQDQLIFFRKLLTDFSGTDK